jgi:CheY-like chemotaxis protein
MEGEMEFLIISLVSIILLPIVFGWLIIGIAPFIMVFIGVLYMLAIMNRRLELKFIAAEPKPDLVLVVDDEYQSVIPLLKLLAQSKIPFKYVSDGFSAIKELNRGAFKLIFMDMVMPNISGLETLERADKEILKKSRRIPVVLYSGSETEILVNPNLNNLSVIERWSKSMNLFKLHSQLNKVLLSTVT